eukprot:Gregarina_sp_Poly_1__4956@NODE_2626_length_1900_cov_100_691217_g54_i3_p1_GENE_NODE_2626_length_1900_cov_100_691217_g54_i3NODE_2626_length_1900_cov_100_691217_g54_i3_p1_ORF_typecomplete_len437_score58_25Mqo/PF06039_15/2_2e108DAO/PF01266_24/2_6e18Pyr_redox_3/PF13738_6/0_073Pyr_redox_3/PF13738_6/0_026GMC_oxred_N/PF00732_19/0_00016Lycopene_cycl/PF05834_12/0_0013Lycopene_cycl/PF05834_12/5_7e02FAD_binding_3/PF01494_19/0_0008FAD_binding_3/PF01494_19/2_2e03NAD_binding_8/PF13450_6/0_0032Thi4/PF01946_17/0
MSNIARFIPGRSLTQAADRALSFIARSALKAPVASSGQKWAFIDNEIPKQRGIAKRFAMIRPEQMMRESFESGLPETADVIIIGGGVTGAALLYELAEFTDLKRVLLLERREGFARVASGPNNNSQTIHCGDIETNYTPQKAASVQRLANMLRNFATKLPEHEREKTIAKMQKMAIGVGDKECAYMEKRFEEFSPYFKKLQLLNKEQIAKFEPAVIYKDLTSRTMRPENVVANFVADEYSAVDYFHLTKNLVNSAEAGRDNRDIRAVSGCEMWDIQRVEDGWRVFTNKGPIDARFVVVSACGYSLLAAHRLGYARHFSCLPVAGSFYFGPKILNGKVYAVQNPLLPFAAVHGDPDLVAGRKTRFGPTALPLPLLERYNLSSFWDFLEVLKPNIALAKVYFDLFKQPTIRSYMIRNALFEVPYLNDRLFHKVSANGS